MSGGIFISYRRDDSRHAAGRLVERLGREYSRDQLFMDIDGIEPGSDFLKVINDKLNGCDVVLTVIGPGWLHAADAQGRRRLADPADFVRLEIETALRRDIRVIPVLVDGAYMPREDELPEPLRPLARRNAVRLNHETFGADADKLATALSGGKPAPARTDATSTPAPPIDGSQKPDRLAIKAAWLIVVVIAQIAAAVWLAPLLKGLMPPWRQQYDIFLLAFLQTTVISLTAMLFSVVSRDAPVAFAGASIISLLFACGGAALTQMPDVMKVLEVTWPILRGSRWLYPLAGAMAGYLLMSTSPRR